MANRWINSWNWQTILWGSKITADGDCSHEIKDAYSMEGNLCSTLHSILKIRDITLPTKVHLVKAMIFPVVEYRCELDYKESWVPNNWCFWTVMLEKTLDSPLDCKKIKPVHPKGDQSWVLAGGLMLKLKLQYFGHPMQRADSFEKTLMIEGRRRRGRQKMRWLDGITDSMDMVLGEDRKSTRLNSSH